MGTPTKLILILGILFCGMSGFSQSISAIIVDASSEGPLESVSVYYDGTTVGTVTDQMGRFNLRSDFKTEAAIVVSYLGYETQYFDQDQLLKSDTIYLRESPESLEAVVLEIDPWSREKKLNVFRREFLGRELAAKECRILNEDDITLIYQPSQNVLRAYADRPIIVKNRYLGYELNYALADFEVIFTSGSSGLRYTESVFMAGSTVFKESDTKVRKRHREAREKEYLGSSLQFMRALSSRELESKKFRCFINDTVNNSKLFYTIDPYDYLVLQKNESGELSVRAKFEKLVVQYDLNKQSGLHPKDGASEFVIDDFGIHSPPDAILFSGDFGLKRIATMLPADYRLETNE